MFKALENLMGFFFRKSIKLGPFRINLSKSGIGVSSGFKGARISTGPRGTQVNLGRKGLYYRKQLSHRAAQGEGWLPRLFAYFFSDKQVAPIPMPEFSITEEVPEFLPQGQSPVAVGQSVLPGVNASLRR